MSLVFLEYILKIGLHRWQLDNMGVGNITQLSMGEYCYVPLRMCRLVIDWLT